MNKAEELIACLEGEIAKRDEELAACHVSVENCELFRARIAELEAWKAQGVVMPERWNVPRPMWKDARQPYGNPLNHADIEAAEKFNLALDEVARLNAASSPAGVDGLEVVATAILGGIEYGISGPELGGIDVELSMSALRRIQEQMISNEDSVYLDLCCLSDAQAIIDGLRGEVEERVEAALAEDRAVRHQQAQRIDQLESLLRSAKRQLPANSGLYLRIDAALSAGKKGE